ncbi:hypothetical protein M409DRAFT_53194 [Zasmidium cellare ATCC 36951]|uniref:Uncharacterized protein n=1 Tax=Zasmidium cellare ATCC 36951 TaxID=1080233 RepID=A0A6A6CNB0_ZASCE|nr:uncharacterized protein M409DRAFT_53194 [Zasmidium cellare ATCC 36951]KAF2168531.1 hypothetical protein M409DRAFT_53194 [Zasmidium cellare ATCC 36951]
MRRWSTVRTGWFGAEGRGWRGIYKSGEMPVKYWLSASNFIKQLQSQDSRPTLNQPLPISTTPPPKTTNMFSLTTKALAAALAITGTTAAVLPRQGLTWQVSDFSTASRDGGDTIYNATINVETTTAHCVSGNAVASSACPGQNGPSPFLLSTCGLDSGVEWELFSTTSPTLGGGEAFYVQFRQVGESETLYGCSPLFKASNYTCEAQPAPGETLVVPTEFAIKPSGNSECVYA